MSRIQDAAHENTAFNIPNLGAFPADSGLQSMVVCSDGKHRAGHNGVTEIVATGDGKVEFICYPDYALAYVTSALGYPAYYPLNPVALRKPVQAVLMDLDGTTVHSEEFWIWIIQLTVASLLGNARFELEESDLPYVAGNSISEHLTYCLTKYCPEKTLHEARQNYFIHAQREMQAIVDGGGRSDAFQPIAGVKEFLLRLKAHDIKIALVTSGGYEKAYPEILSAFKTMGLGAPEDFYDAIITAGFAAKKGAFGTLSELPPKPHPWLYAEAARIGLGIPPEQRDHVVGIEDSGAGVCAVRLAGFTTIGVAGGNILASGTRALCHDYCMDFDGIEQIIL